MVADAEKFKGEDEVIKKRVEAKNGLENYCYSMKNSLTDEKLKEKFTDDDKKQIEEGIQEALKWIEENQTSEAEEYEKRQKDLEAKFNPIMMRIYQAAGGAPDGMPGNFPGAAPGGAGATAGPGGADELD